ncbi:SMI1/KNR4 family protein [Streptomyces sp. NPDC052676]|uniref:SMI1/KNR4 family protein n=1 Tax=Streptomyces sp. NPDC052676 TaxID=3154953 RepID=UPI00341B181A
MTSIHDFATWEPLLRLLRAHAGDGAGAGVPSGRVGGRIGRYGWSLPLHRPMPRLGRAVQVEDMQDEFDAVERVREALPGDEEVSFAAEFGPDGRAVVHVLGSSPAVESGLGGRPGALVLVEGAVPAPWRRLPEPVAEGVRPAPSADPELVARTLRERLPKAIGATEEEIAETEARLGVALPEELKALYRVTRARWEDLGDDYAAAQRHAKAVRCELFSLDGLYVSDVSARQCLWQFGATKAAVTAPDAAVQYLVGSPGWIVFADNGGGDRIAIDLTPGPRGHLGQVIMLSHEEDLGAALIADSVTDFLLGRPSALSDGLGVNDLRSVAHVNTGSLPSVEAAVHPALEVLSIGVWEGEPLSLAPVAGLPRLRTLTAYPGTLADPLEITELTGLEYLELGPREWRVLLDARAVPRGLSAAGIEVHGDADPLAVVELANEILALWDRPLISRTVLEGTLDPAR